MTRIPLHAVIETILEDTKFSSRAVDALRHPLFVWMKSLEDRRGVLLALFKELYQVPMSSAHLMSMIFDLIPEGEHGPKIPLREQGVITAMRARILAWGRDEGFLPGGVPENKRVVHLLAMGIALCGKTGQPREWGMEHWWVPVDDLKNANCPGCIKKHAQLKKDREAV